ncbi:transferase, transferring glycosyl groups, putative [Ricinus communis]|uniref:Transferase, transferring glycosyl groups, putative n=1 Tax=Ricinus communis TaxID=3988 RepID=B9RPQ4_RICCO|nr:transferase, transferring glycosyl groups, putative [Ricinus communis]
MYLNRKRKHKSLTNMPPVTATTPTTTTTTGKTLSLAPSRLKDLLLVLSFLIILHLIFHSPSPPSLSRAFIPISTPTTRHHLLFSIASSSSSFTRREPYLRLWYNPNSTRAFAFLDVNTSSLSVDPTLPPVIISKDTSRFPYTFKGGLRSAIRVARVVKEAVDKNVPDIRWFVFGDDDTVFFVDSLVKTLSFYDHNKWYYIGSNSESYEQNMKYSFDMGFGGGGFVISYSLAKVLARVLDSCLVRYGHLYGSDARVFSCLAELGVGLTHEPGFHQVDMRGNLFGMLSAHPLSPLLSLHHLDAADPLFPI